MNKNGNKNSNKNKNKNVENNGTINTSNQINNNNYHLNKLFKEQNNIYQNLSTVANNQINNNNNYHLNKLFKEQNNIYPNLSTIATEKTNPSKRKFGLLQNKRNKYMFNTEERRKEAERQKEYTAKYGNIYYSETRKNAIEGKRNTRETYDRKIQNQIKAIKRNNATQTGNKKNNPIIPYENMLSTMKYRMDIEGRRLHILNELGFALTESNIKYNKVYDENIKLIVNYTISNNNLKDTMKNENNRELYNELLWLDIDEYMARYKRYHKIMINNELKNIENATKKERIMRTLYGKLYGNLKKINNAILEIMENVEGTYYKNNHGRKIYTTKGTGDYREVQQKIKRALIKLEMPNIYFDIFRTRKYLENLREQAQYLKNIDYRFMCTDIDAKIRKNLETKKDLKKYNVNNNLNELIDLLGINKIKKYRNINSYNKNKNNFLNINASIYENIATEILEYMVDIDAPFVDTQSPLFLREKDYLKLKISYNLLKNFNSTGIYDKFTIGEKPIKAGFVGTLFGRDGLILKYENLRFSTLSKKYIENVKGKTTEYSLGDLTYDFNNYVPYTSSIQALIQNYLYKLCDKYVPEFKNYFLSYNEGLSLIVMDCAFNKCETSKNNEFIGTLYDFMEKESVKYDNVDIYILNVLKIWQKVCEILSFYQEKCYFVHGDLHAGNMMICCDFDENKIIKNLHVKLIDFGFSSIILNINRQYKILKDVGLMQNKSYNQINPNISSLWNKIDILYLTTATYYHFKKSNKNNIRLMNYILNIFEIPEKIYEIIFPNNNKNNLDQFNTFISFFKIKSKFDEIYKTKTIEEKNKLYSKYIPSELLKKLLEIINEK